MKTQLKYMPVFRSRLQEIGVLKSFDFGDRIYPCIEIIRELDRYNSKPTKAKGIFKQNNKTFEDIYLPLISCIKAPRVFVDLPIHLKPTKGMNPFTIKFLSTVVANREKRTEYLKKFIPLSSKVIPIISSYLGITGERKSIILQEQELRPHFKNLAFRTYFETFPRDIIQIKESIQPNDYIIMDWGELELDLQDEDQKEIVTELRKLNCTIIIHRNPFPKEIRISSLVHGDIVSSIDNSLLDNYRHFAGSSFSDYAGIKKDNIDNGGVISPGLIFYDAIINKFFGFRYKDGSHKKGEEKPKIEEFETTIIPAVINSKSVKSMHSNQLNFLGVENKGWVLIKNINSGVESGKNAAKFKRISMEHYLHCIKTKIANGDFN